MPKIQDLKSQVKPNDSIVLYDASLKGNYVYRNHGDNHHLSSYINVMSFENDNDILRINVVVTSWMKGYPNGRSFSHQDTTWTEVERLVNEGICNLFVTRGEYPTIIILDIH